MWEDRSRTGSCDSETWQIQNLIGEASRLETGERAIEAAEVHCQEQIEAPVGHGQEVVS